MWMLKSVRPVAKGSAPAASRWVTFTGVMVLVAALVFAAQVLVPVLLAVVLSILLHPAVRKLTRWRLPRVLAAGLLLATIVALLALAALLLYEPMSALAAKAPQVISEVRATLDKVTVVAAGGPRAPRAPAAATAATSATMLAAAGWLAKQATDAAFAMGLAVVLTYFTLVWGTHLERAVISALRPRPQRRVLLQICRSVRTEVSRYLSTIAWVNLCFGVVTALVLYLAGTRHALAFGILATLLNFVPFVGAAILFALLGIASASDYGLAVAALAPPLAFLGVHLLESQFVTPHILGRRLVLNPLIVVVSVVIGAALWGLGGAFLAVPILIALKVAGDTVPEWRRWAQVLGRGSGVATQLRPQPAGQPLEWSRDIQTLPPAPPHQAPRSRQIRLK